MDTMEDTNNPGRNNSDDEIVNQPDTNPDTTDGWSLITVAYAGGDIHTNLNMSGQSNRKALPPGQTSMSLPPAPQKERKKNFPTYLKRKLPVKQKLNFNQEPTTQMEITTSDEELMNLTTPEQIPGSPSLSTKQTSKKQRNSPNHTE